ncbi:MAG TPA: hypothetical protein VLZ10_09770 [Thermodesulfobacteriota bacterium]|nr:hypothetical protein [Thermodesulfobacteriota bacterium]
MTTEELAEFFLARLYELAEEAPHPNFLFSVENVLREFEITDREELQSALNYLGERGFIILASDDRVGGMSVGITLEGSTFVEKGGETGMIESYRRPLQTSSKTCFAPSPLPINQERTEGVKEEQDLFYARRAVEALLEDIEDVLKKDDTVAAEVKSDLLSDLATFKIQMSRNVRSGQIIDVLLGHLSRTPSIAPLVTGLTHIVDIYFR